MDITDFDAGRALKSGEEFKNIFSRLFKRNLPKDGAGSFLGFTDARLVCFKSSKNISCVLRVKCAEKLT